MLSFNEIFADSTKHCKKIKTDEYHETGKNMIVDQGQSEIAGYTDLEEGLFSDVPAIIFGDHTRIIKYVDKPFFIGADGVKVLKSKLEKANYRYLYYALKNVKIPNTGYNRHFKWLKETIFNYPNSDRQQEIVLILDKLQSIITHIRTQLEKLDLLVKSRFVEMFKDVKDFVPLSFYINSLLAGKSLAGEESCKNKVLKTEAVSYNYFDNSQIKNLPNKYIPLEEHRVNDGDVIISRMNTSELVGAAAYVWEAPANTFLPDRLWKANLNEEANPIFIWQLLIQQTTKDEMKKIASGTSGSMKNISKSGLLGIKVIKIAFDAQTQFANFVKQVEKSRCALQQELTQTQTLFNSLMQEYFG